jgi:sortase (surface protein transpeptidase)
MLEATEPKHRFKIPKLTKLQYSLLSLALVVLITGGYFGISGLQAVNTANVQAFKLTSLANQANKSTASVGSTKNPALSTTPISASTLADYSVAPNLPRYLIIPKLNVDARILSVGVTSTGAVGTPDNIYDTAWYNESAEPGQPGATLIDGHVSSWTAHGVFYGIKTLVAGDTIQVERGDGTMYTYKVVSSQVYPSGNVNMQAAITPVVSGQPGLNLITCAGDVIPGTNSFSERIIVFATQVSPSP